MPSPCVDFIVHPEWYPWCNFQARNPVPQIKPNGLTNVQISRGNSHYYTWDLLRCVLCLLRHFCPSWQSISSLASKLALGERVGGFGLVLPSDLRHCGKPLESGSILMNGVIGPQSLPTFPLFPGICFRNLFQFLNWAFVSTTFLHYDSDTRKS